MQQLVKFAGISWLVVLSCWSAPCAALNAADTVEQWGLYEISLQGPTGGNPFLDINFSARFTQGDDSIDVPGFYDGDGNYRVRFMPQKLGLWKYRTVAAPVS